MSKYDREVFSFVMFGYYKNTTIYCMAYKQ